MARRACVLGLVIGVCSPALADTVRVAVAANFVAPMAQIAQAFNAATGHEAVLSPGPTLRLFTQISRGGAPFDVLVSADAQTPERLVREGHAQVGTAFTYATGQLVLWSPEASLVDAQGEVLAASSWRWLALANPKLAPYGRAAQEVLQAKGLAAQLQPRLVMGESVAQAYQFVYSGQAQLGFVALSQIQRPGQPVVGSVWRVPPSLHAPLQQDAVLLNAGKANAAAHALLDFMKTSAARRIMQGFGYRH